jgi:hypothetical protein
MFLKIVHVYCACHSIFTVNDLKKSSLLGDQKVKKNIRPSLFVMSGKLVKKKGKKKKKKKKEKFHGWFLADCMNRKVSGNIEKC